MRSGGPAAGRYTRHVARVLKSFPLNGTKRATTLRVTAAADAASE